MTKKEQAQMDALAKALAEARALCYPQYPKPKSMTVDELTPAENKYAGGVVVAWHQHNHECSYRVGQGCSNGTSHSRWSTEKTNSQTPGVFYRTKIEALQAARHEMTERFAQALARIDAEIASESGKGSENEMTPEEIARQFHDTYERLAPAFGYETRQDTRSFDPESPNGRLMIAVCGEVLTALREKLAAAEASLAERGRMLETTHRVQRSYRAAVAAALAELRATVRFEAVSVEYPPDLVGEFLEKKQVLTDIDATIAKLGLTEQEQPK